MAGGTRTVSVELKALVGNYVNGMKQAERSTSGVRGALDGMRNMSEKTANRLSTVGMVAAGALAVGAYKAVQAASDLNESMSKTQAVFGDSTDAMVRWASGAADAFGQSKQQALEAASTFGNLFVAMDIGTAESAQMSRQLVRLASDLSSFNNVPVEDALLALRSGLTGETEPLRRFGVNLNDATLKQKALDLGLVTTTKGTLPPAIKAQAAYALILEQTTVAQGDFARTADGLANSTRTMQARAADAAATFGQELMPMMTGATRGASNFLAGLNQMPDALRLTFEGVAALAAGTLVLGPRLLTASQSLSALSERAPLAAARIKGVGLALGGITAAITVATALWAAYAGAQAEAKAAGQMLADNIDRTTGAMNALGKLDLGKRFLDNFSLKDLEKTPFTLKDIVDAAAEGGAAFDALLARIKEWQNAQGGFDLTPWDNDPRELYLAAEALGRDATAGREAASAADAAAGSFGESGTAAETAAVKVKTLSDAYSAMSGELNIMRDRLAYKDAIDGLGQAFEGLKGKELAAAKGLDINTKAGRAATGALLDLVDAAGKDIANAEKQGATQKQVAALTSAHKVEIIKAAAALGIGSSKAAGYAAKLDAIPGAVDTSIILNGTDDAAAKLAQLIKRREAFIDVYVRQHLTSRADAAASHYNTTATGGNRGAGFTSLVGENGPELVTFASPVRVTPAPATRMSLARATFHPKGGDGSSSGGITVGTINVRSAPGEAAGETIPRALRRMAWLQGGL